MTKEVRPSAASGSKTNLSRVPTNALWKELERRSSKEYAKEVRREMRHWRKIQARRTGLRKPR